MSKTKTEINPCPQCGGPADTIKADERLGGVYLTACKQFDPDNEDGCCMIGAGWTEEESIQDWNAFSKTVTEAEYRREYLVDPYRSRYNAMD